MPDPVAAKLEELKAVLAGEPLVAAADKERLERGKKILYELGILLTQESRDDVPLTPAEAFLWAEELEDPETLGEVLNRLQGAPPTSPAAAASGIATGPASAARGIRWSEVAQGVLTTVLAALVLYWVLPKRR